MQILHIYDHTEPNHSGYVFRSRSLRQALERAGHQCDILSMPRHYGDQQKTTYETSADIIDHKTYFRTPPTKIRIPILREIWDIYQGYKRIKTCITTKDYEIIHVHSPVLGAISALAARLITRKKHIKVVYEIRAFWEDAAVDHGSTTPQSLKYKATRALESWACRQVDHIYPICKGLKNDLVARNICADKITIISNVVTENAFAAISPEKITYSNDIKHKYNITPETHIIGFIGSFYHYEGLEDLMPLMKYFKQINYPIKLLLVGSGLDAEKIKLYIQENALEDYIILTGRVPHDTVISYYHICDAMIYPRRAIRLTETVTPLKPLEAAAAKVPVILSNIGGHRELLQNHQTGFFIDDFNNTTQAADRIINILQEKNTLNQVVENAYMHVKQNHIADSIVKKYYQF